MNLAFVPVVVLDKKGHAVGDLKKEDFQVFDSGKPEVISGFTVEKREVTESAPANAVRSVAQVSTPNTPPQVAVLPKRITVYLFDDLHLSAADLAYLKKIDANALDGALVDSDMAAVVSTSGRVNSGPRVIAQIFARRDHEPGTKKSVHIRRGELSEDRLLPSRLNREQARSHRFRKCIGAGIRLWPSSGQAAGSLPGSIDGALHRQASLLTGDEDVQVTLVAIKEFVRRMAKMPGERTLILVSPGFLSITPEALNWESQIIDLAVESSVTINALDARGLYTGVTDISERGVTQIIDLVRLAAMTHAEGVMSELADGTGGTFFHNNNDLKAGFKSLTDGPEVVYVLELSLDGVKPDGSDHRVKVKVDRAGMQIQAATVTLHPSKRRTRNRKGFRVVKPHGRITGLSDKWPVEHSSAPPRQLTTNRQITRWEVFEPVE